MKKNLLFFTLFCCVTACTEPQTKPNPENPVALQPKTSTETILYSRGSDLLEEIYEEITKQSAELKQVEDALKAFEQQSKYAATKQQYEQYHLQSRQYYQSAEQKLNTVQNQELRKKIVDLVKNSEKQYEERIATLKQLIKQIEKKQIAIEDAHKVLKIVKTLPYIEKYQKNSLPKTTDFEAHLAKQDTLLKKIEHTTAQ